MPRTNPGCRFTSLALVAAAVAASPASAEVIFETNDPFGGPFGIIGYDVCTTQSVALRFIPDRDYTLDRLSMWIMSNDFEGPSGEIVNVTIRTDDASGGTSVPGDTILEAFEVATSAVGWDPVLETVESSEHPVLKAGERYWLVLMSDAEPLFNPVWAWASTGLAFMSNTSGDQTEWQAGGDSAAAACIIEGTPVCRADFDGNGSVNTLDFIAFLNAFNSGDERADFDGNGTINTLDFLAFLNAFNTGC